MHGEDTHIALPPDTSQHGHHEFVKSSEVPASIQPRREKEKRYRNLRKDNVPSAKCPLAILHVFASAADDVVPAAICTRACNNLNDFSTAAIHSNRQLNSLTITMT
jgi:hypothetical protein